MTSSTKLPFALRKIPWVRAVANLAHGLNDKHILAFQALWRGQRAFLVVNGDMRHWAPVLHTRIVRARAPNVPVPAVRLSERELSRQLALTSAVLQEFREDGIIFITERREPAWTAREWLQNLCREGAAVMMMEDATTLVAAQDINAAERLFYLPAGWRPPEVRMAEALGVTKIFTIASDVLEQARPVLIIVTPGLPVRFRVWPVNVATTLGHEIQLAAR